MMKKAGKKLGIKLGEGNGFGLKTKQRVNPEGLGCSSRAVKSNPEWYLDLLELNGSYLIIERFGFHAEWIIEKESKQQF